MIGLMMVLMEGLSLEEALMCLSRIESGLRETESKRKGKRGIN